MATKKQNHGYKTLPHPVCDRHRRTQNRAAVFQPVPQQGDSVVQVECLKNQHNSSPLQVLKIMENRLRKSDLKPSDQAWVVVDKDNWPEEQLSQLHNWSKDRDNRGFALSNPKFEYWLLLHFEDGKGVATPRNCKRKLQHYLPKYDKDINPDRFTSDLIKQAIKHARIRDNPACQDWPRNPGATTAYRLVEQLHPD